MRTAADFYEMSGDIGDPKCVPSAPWMDFATSGENHAVVRCWGMLAFGLIDLAVPINASPDSPEFEHALDKALQALHYATWTVVARNLECKVDEVLEIPVSFRMDACGAHDSSEESVSYRGGGADDDPFWLLQPEHSTVNTRAKEVESTATAQ